MIDATQRGWGAGRIPVDRPAPSVFPNDPMSATPPLPSPTEVTSNTTKPAGTVATYEAPTFVELGTLKDLTAAGSFIDPT